MGGRMSSTGEKRPHADALADAHALRDLFPPKCYERWEFAGSLRRRAAEVGDVEHCIIPRWGEANGGNLFGVAEPVNLLWLHLDALLKGHAIDKHLYGDASGYRWGPLYRGLDFRGHMHEL